MTEAELVEFVTQYYPEWSVSKQEYQPTDIGSMNANMDLFKDESGLIKDWVLGLLTDSMDMGALQPVNEFDEEPPATPMSDWYMSSGNYEEMFTSLSNRETPETAAYNQYIREGLPDFEMDQPNKPTRFNELLNVAKQVLPEIAGFSAYEQRRDFAAANPTGLSPLQEDLQAAGIFTGPTPDEWYSDSILQDRENALASQQEFERLQARQDASVEDEDRFAGSNPHQGALEAFLASQAPGTPEATTGELREPHGGGGGMWGQEGEFLGSVGPAIAGMFSGGDSYAPPPDHGDGAGMIGQRGELFGSLNPMNWSMFGGGGSAPNPAPEQWDGTPDRESWRGDPRDKRSHVGKVADWDYQKKMYEQTAGGRSKRKEQQDQKYFDAKRDSVWNAMKLDIEERAIAQARGSNNIQKQQILDRFLGLPRG
jgi:hypothetical protein